MITFGIISDVITCVVVCVCDEEIIRKWNISKGLRAEKPWESIRLCSMLQEIPIFSFFFWCEGSWNIYGEIVCFPRRQSVIWPRG